MRTGALARAGAPLSSVEEALHRALPGVAPHTPALLTPAQQYALVLAAAEEAQDAILRTDAEIAGYLQVSLQTWRRLYEGDPTLRALAANVAVGDKRQLRWRRSDVERHLRRR